MTAKEFWNFRTMSSDGMTLDDLCEFATAYHAHESAQPARPKPDLSVRGSEEERSAHQLDILEQWKPAQLREAGPECAHPFNKGYLNCPFCGKQLEIPSSPPSLPGGSK